MDGRSGGHDEVNNNSAKTPYKTYGCFLISRFVCYVSRFDE